MKELERMVASALLAGMLAAGTAVDALAGSLELVVEPPEIGTGFSFVDFFAFGDDGDLSAFGATLDSVNGASPVGTAELGFGVGFDLADPAGDASGGFDVFDDVGLFLGGDLLAVGYADDLIEFQFANLVGAAADQFGQSVLMTVSFDQPLGPNPFAGLVDGEVYTAAITVSKVVVEPVLMSAPGSLPLLLLAPLIGFVRRSRSAHCRARSA